jgi:hypothetical protein
VIAMRALLDAYVPVPDAVERHAVVVHASPAAVEDALWRADLGGPLVRALLAVRVLPAALRGSAGARARLRALRREALTLHALSAGGFALLARTPTAVVFGLTGRFWTLGGGIVPTDPAAWDAGPPPGTAQAAWSFELLPHGDGRSWLVTETRVRCADAATRRAFGRYWRVVRPGSALLRHLMLRQIRRCAERRPTAAPAG